jgi:hypothetical protein
MRREGYSIKSKAFRLKFLIVRLIGFLWTKEFYFEGEEVLVIFPMFFLKKLLSCLWKGKVAF